MIIKIKPLTPDLIDDILLLDQRFKSPWSPELYLERLEIFPHFALGAFNMRNKLIGFIIGKIKSNNSILVSRIVVAKRYEGKGVAKMLMNAFSEKTQLIKKESSVRIDNIRALMLHITTGFILIPERNKRYDNGDLGVIFKK